MTRFEVFKHMFIRLIKANADSKTYRDWMRQRPLFSQIVFHPENGFSLLGWSFHVNGNPNRAKDWRIMAQSFLFNQMGFKGIIEQEVARHFPEFVVLDLNDRSLYIRSIFDSLVSFLFVKDNPQKVDEFNLIHAIDLTQAALHGYLINFLQEEYNEPHTKN